MNLLLDTHVFLWYISGSSRMPRSWLTELRDPRNTVYLSVVSIWEASIQYHSGKLELPGPPEDYLPAKRKEHLIASLPLNELDIAKWTTLPQLHRDPIDRILICQALQNGLTLVTVDKDIRSYSVPLLPA